MKRSHDTLTVSRRHMLQSSAVGFGAVALQGLLGLEASADDQRSPPQLRSSEKPPHFAPRAKRVIFLFMKGGPSHIDTFEPKPRLQKEDGKELPFEKPRVQFGKTTKLLASPWKFQQYGESGLPVSSLFPNVARHVDDLCMLHSLHGTNAAHGGALLKLHTGSDNFVRPSMGAWVNYGLGSENDSLPGFVTICPTLAHGGVKNWGAAFLPAQYQGVPLGVASKPAIEAKIAHASALRSPDLQRLQLDFVRQLNERHLESTGPMDELESRIQAMELAYRMQSQAPEAVDLSEETQATQQMYGIDEKVTEDFGRQCLLARRFAERGVRFIQVTHSDSMVQWDQHSNLKSGHDKNALEVDKPIAGLLRDLKQRGLLHDTLVLWGGEFGRTPVAQGGNGRDHNPEGFTMWMAGGGVKGGYRHGATDEYGYYAEQDRMHIHDLHATMLHLMGLDHERLTHRHAGRDFRLTDVAGKVVDAIFA